MMETLGISMAVLTIPKSVVDPDPQDHFFDYRSLFHHGQYILLIGPADPNIFYQLGFSEVVENVEPLPPKHDKLDTSAVVSIAISSGVLGIVCSLP
jgi:hypothetical protein